MTINFDAVVIGLLVYIACTLTITQFFVMNVWARLRHM